MSSHHAPVCHMDDFLTFLHQIATRLDSAQIPYMITGSMAFAFYATPRMTRDIDIVIALSPTDTERLVSLFQHDCYLDQESITQAIRRHGMFNIIHNETIIKADFIVRKDDAYRRIEFSRRRAIDIGGVMIYLVAPEDLILSKLVWAQDSASELQLRDIKQMLCSATGLEMDYLREWAQYLKVDKRLAEVMRDA